MSGSHTQSQQWEREVSLIQSMWAGVRRVVLQKEAKMVLKEDGGGEAGRAMPALHL